MALKRSLTAVLACAIAVCAQLEGLTELTPSFLPLQEDAGTTSLFPMPPCGNFDLVEATIDDIQAAMANGTLTSTQLVICCLQRTYQTQDYLRSIAQVNPDVFAIAAALDAERATGSVHPHG
ncbi:uncharacterized protein B0H64DRAFT_324400 [Chaetomium fimeti]|uniref:Uncharacterized protein n=1 Tax=Chaetomium fimeti TaxID=1854472 RepID=A0AAE0HCU3_9PEZI|nr:hypothetical protein B0H64DRAFT_324400 [Chaetomium fimeti]